MYDDNKERAFCIQQMNECAAAIRFVGDTEQGIRMRLRLAALVRYAENRNWLPKCFSIDRDLEV